MTTKTTTFRRAALASSAPLLLLTTLLGSAGPAEALSTRIGFTDGDGVALRDRPLANAKIQPMIVLRDGTPVSITCQTWSPDVVGPRANHVFDRIDYPRAGETWVPDAYVDGTAAANQFTAGIPRCGDQVPVPPAATSAQRAVDWARARVGNRTWDGLCLGFAAQAYRAAGVDIGSSYSAVTWWNEHRGRQVRSTGAPFGALVFWGADRYNADGHVGISLGDGTAISTAERTAVGVHVFSIADRNRTKPYLGYVVP